MSRPGLPLATLTFALVASIATAECVPFDKAPEKLGEVACIRGKVLKATEGTKGVRFLNFCEEHVDCPFVVVMFPNDLRDVGDFRLLEGKTIEINGKVKQYRSQIEIVLKDRKQLRGEYANLPNLPKDFEVDRHGTFSAGKFSGPKSAHKTGARPKTPRQIESQQEEQ